MPLTVSPDRVFAHEQLVLGKLKLAGQLAFLRKPAIPKGNVTGSKLLRADVVQCARSIASPLHSHTVQQLLSGEKAPKVLHFVSGWNMFQPNWNDGFRSCWVPSGFEINRRVHAIEAS